MADAGETYWQVMQSSSSVEVDETRLLIGHHACVNCTHLRMQKQADAAKPHRLSYVAWVTDWLRAGG